MHPVNRLLSLVGLRLSRVDRPQLLPKRMRVVEISGFRIKMPLGLMYRVYTANPEYSSEIGRVATAVYSRYPDMICVDIGANIGDTAAIIRGACPAPLICIEGDHALIDVLAENAGQLGGVSLIHTYLGDRQGAQQVMIEKQGWNSTLLPVSKGAPGVAVKFTTLDEVVGREKWGRVKFVKIDTEGYEGRILRGARQILRQGRPAILFEHNREALDASGENGASLFTELKELGYQSLLFWDAHGRFVLGASLDNIGQVLDLHEYVAFDGAHRLGEISYFDVCAFHEQDGEVAERCLTVERARVRGQRTDSVS